MKYQNIKKSQFKGLQDEKFLTLMTVISYIFIISCSAIGEIIYTDKDFIKTFNESLKSMKLDKYILEEGQATHVKEKGMNTLTAQNSLITVMLKEDPAKKQVISFEVTAKLELLPEELENIKMLIKNTFKNQEFYNQNSGVGSKSKVIISYTLK